MSLSLKILQREAITYLIGTIADCGNTLSKTMLQTVDLNEGTCFTIIPASTSEDHLYKFKTGGLMMEQQGTKMTPISVEITPTVKRIIELFLNISENYCAVSEDILTYANEIGKQRDERWSYLVLGGEVYLFNSHEDDATKVVANLRASNAMYYSFFALLSLDTAQQKRLNQAKTYLNKEDIALLATSVQGIVQAAYDGESYLIWDRDGTLLRLAEEQIKQLESSGQ